jgi:hypothetical protein
MLWRSAAVLRRDPRGSRPMGALRTHRHAGHGRTAYGPARRPTRENHVYRSRSVHAVAVRAQLSAAYASGHCVRASRVTPARASPESSLHTTGEPRRSRSGWQALRARTSSDRGLRPVAVTEIAARAVAGALVVAGLVAFLYFFGPAMAARRPKASRRPTVKPISPGVLFSPACGLPKAKPVPGVIVADGACLPRGASHRARATSVRSVGRAAMPIPASGSRYS